MAGCLATVVLAQTAGARLYDEFSSGANWNLTNNSGSATIASSVLTLTAPASVLSTPSATLISAQALTGTRQSILVRSHSGVANSTVFFLWAIDASTGNKLELKLDDVGPTTVVAGYYTSGTYHFVSSAAYSPDHDGLYMAFKESGGATYWEISTDGSTWTDVATNAGHPVNPASLTFEVQHKAYAATAAATATVVDCFNYKATGIGYHSLEDKTGTTGDGWHLYTEGFGPGGMVCSSDAGTPCNMVINGVDSSQHFSDTSIPAPYTNQTGIDFRIISTTAATTTPGIYFNAYRYQPLTYVDANNFTYHIYFKYTYPQFITQGLEFPINKYTGTQRLQGAVAWYPIRPNGGDTGLWKVWSGTNWVSTTQSQTLHSNWWYEVTFNVGLHDNHVYYHGFQAGTIGSPTSFTCNNSYLGTSSTHAINITAAMQMDDNNVDTNTAGTQKDVYLSEWHVDWTDEKLQ